MGDEGDAMADIRETGHIYFFYRPRVQEEEAYGLDDVQRFQIVLSPRGGRRYRLITIGRKRMPEVRDGRAGERVWGFVDKVGRRPSQVEDLLDRHQYETATRGERVLSAARPAGQGVYAIVRHGTHTHLAYVLEFPKEPGQVQSDLDIEKKGSYIVTVRNPDAPAPPQAGLVGGQKAALPEKLRRRFRGRRFAELEPDFLDHEGTELVFIGAKTSPEEELGITLAPEDERENEAAIFRDLELERDQHPLEPLFEGEWR